MIENFLRTKLVVPPLRQNLVPRQRLVQRLNAGLQPGIRMLLVAAPAGFGKTTLVSTWAQSAAVTIAWLSLDDGDNDLNRFWRYVTAALAAAQPEIGELSRSILSTGVSPPLDAIQSLLVNQLAEVNGPLLLGLDDYHHILNEQIHDSLNRFTDRMPHQHRLVVMSRSDPALLLARRRARGELLEVRTADLRFTSDEIYLLLNETLKLGLTREDIAALDSRLEGWIAGLTLTAIALEAAPDRHAYVQALQGDDRYIADYLIEEVLERQPPDLQEFLLNTSVLSQMCAPLCSALTDRPDAQAILIALEKSNLFITPLDNRREWFRYHPLFASLLRHRLVELRGEQVEKSLLKRAAAWYAANKLPVQAVEIALSGGDIEHAVILIEDQLQELFMQSEISTLHTWSLSLPDRLLQGNPRLCVAFGWAAHASGHPQDCRRFLDLLYRTAGMTSEHYLNRRQGSDQLDPMLQSALIEAAAIEARLSTDEFDFDRTLRLGNELLPYLTPERDRQPSAFNLPSHLRSPIVFTLGLVAYLRGETGAARAAFDDAAQDGQRLGNVHIIALALGHLGEVQHLCAELHQAEATYHRSLQIAAEFKNRPSPFFGIAYAGLGALAFERNDLDEAASYLLESLDMGRLWRSWEVLLPAGISLARLHDSRHDLDAALSVLVQVEQLTQSITPLAVPLLNATRAVLWARQGRLADALQWALQVPDQPADGLWLIHESLRIAAARIFYIARQPDQALAILESIIPSASAAGRRSRLLEALLLQALAYQDTGKAELAAGSLDRALQIGSHSGHLRTFTNEADALYQALAAKRSSVAPDLRVYLDRILATFPAELPELAPPDSPDAAEWMTAEAASFEPLSERELQVLALIAQGLTNPEIADRLYLSPNTLKAHTQNIYAKLDVHSRVQAVNKARQLGFLPLE